MLGKFLKNGLVLLLVCTLLPVNTYAQSGVTLEPSTAASTETASDIESAGTTEETSGSESVGATEETNSSESVGETEETNSSESVGETEETSETENVSDSVNASGTESIKGTTKQADDKDSDSSKDDADVEIPALENGGTPINDAIGERADSDGDVDMPLFLQSDVAALGISKSQKLVPSTATAEDVEKIMFSIICANEGSYDSVNPNDNTYGISVGIMQWNGTNALNLLKAIITKADAKSKQILIDNLGETNGTALYNKIKTDTSWDGTKDATRFVVTTSQQEAAIKALLKSEAGISIQNSTAESYIYSYIELGYSTYKITNAAALCYFCDLKNQCGTATVARIVASAVKLAGGSVSKVTLNELHEAALMDSVAGNYLSRRYLTYSSVADAAVSNGWAYYNSGSYRIPAKTVGTSTSAEEVKWLQQALKTTISAGLNVDGVYGTKTSAAVKSFQTKYQSTYSLTVDGYAGQQTILALVKVLTATSISLSQPKLGSAANTTSGVKVTWDAVDSATGYYVYRKKSGDTSYSKITTVTSGTSYTDKTASSGTTYTYTVTAYYGEMESTRDETGVSVLYLKTPVLGKASEAATGVKISWEKVTGAGGYYIYRKTGSGSYSKIGTVTSASTLSYTDEAVSTNTTYTYTVYAYSGKTKSSHNSTGLSILYLAAPALSKASASTTGVKVTWAKVGGASGYYVYRKTEGGSYSKIGTVKSGSTVSYTDKTVSSNKTYIYTVKAYNSSVTSSCNSTGLTILYLKTPALSKASATTTGVKVTWEKVSGASGYYVYRKTGSESYSKIGTVKSGSTLSYTDKTVSSNKTYVYTVKAYKSSYSSACNSTGLSFLYLKTPTLEKASEKTTGVKVTWSKVSGASGYYIYRKTGSGSYSKIGTVKSSTTLSYTDKTAKTGKTYVYTVKAYKGSYSSSCNSTGLSILYLAAPVLKSVKLASSGLKVSWEKVSGASGYYVYRKTGSGSYQKIATIESATKLSYTDKTVVSSKTYTYMVKAYKGKVSSSYYTGLSKMYAVYETYKTTASVNYRSGAGTSYAVKGTFAKGTKIEIVTEYSKEANGYTWYKVAVVSKYYYIASNYLKKA